ncbi:MAG: hypothetical protein GF398_15700 [Chitinivibrionales bacterium]|nr:hypothetical protein [Chitinivibrionales bacterium]
MGAAYSIALTICATGALLAEGAVVTMPERVIDLLDNNQEVSELTSFMKFLGVTSLFYLAVLVLLFFSGDRVFRVYAGILIFLSSSMWLLKRFLRRIKYLMIGESTISIIILIDIIRTIFAFKWTG